MLARFLHDNKVENYKNNRSKPYEKAESRVGVHIALRPTLLHANQKPDSIIQNGWSVLQSNCRQTVMFGTQSQSLGKAIPFGWYRGDTQQTRAALQANYGRLRHADCDEAIEKDRLNVMKAKERWQQAKGKEACRYTFRAFLSALAQDLDV